MGKGFWYRTEEDRERARRRAAETTVFLVLLYLAYWAQYSLIYGDPRFGIPVYPLLVGIALTSTHSTARSART